MDRAADGSGRGRLLVSTLIFTVVIGGGIVKLWYDHNLLNMQADGLESVELERKLLNECNQSMWYAVSIADSREELLARKEKLLKMASVERTEEIVSLLPVDHEQKRPIIERIQAKLGESARTTAADSGRSAGRARADARRRAANARCSSNSRAAARTFEQIRDTLRRLARARLLVAALAVSTTDGRRSAQPAARLADDGRSRNRRSSPTCRRAWCIASSARTIATC